MSLRSTGLARSSRTARPFPNEERSTAPGGDGVRPWAAIGIQADYYGAVWMLDMGGGGAAKGGRLGHGRAELHRVINVLPHAMRPNSLQQDLVVGFYRTLDRSRLRTSKAQVFNERGGGIVLRGGEAKLSKDDRQVHLAEDDAYELLDNALKTYREGHRTLLARLVLHKTSPHNGEELLGFGETLRANGVDSADFLSLARSYTRLFRGADYSPESPALIPLLGDASTPGRAVRILSKMRRGGQR